MSEVVAIDEYRRPDSTGRRDQAASTLVRSSATQPNPEKHVFFDRQEFAVILNLYSRMVGRGEWRDYAIGHDRESCSFAVFRRTADGALFRIVKTPKLARKQGAYTILGQGGRILRRGRDLKIMLRYFEPKRDALA